MKKKLLPLAMLAGLAGAAGTAQAVHINNDGLGEVLIYPYYSIEGGQNTYISVVNTTEYYKAVKVRFIEAENSQEVLDFNLYLSPEDVWTGAVVPEGDGAKIITRDNSCTVPHISRPTADNPTAVDGEAFRDLQYADDGGSTGLARTNEGYVELIEMAVVAEDGTGFGTAEGNALAADILHDPSGMPADCAAVVGRWVTSGASFETGDIVDGTGVVSDTGTGTFNTNPNAPSMLVGTDADGTLGGLYGYGVLINPMEGTNATYSARALDAFYDAGAFYAPNHTNPGTLEPSLQNSQVTANILDGVTPVSFVTTDGLDAVSALFMHDTISNDFVLDEIIQAETDWVIAMPTKRRYVFDLQDADDAGTPWNDTLVRPPFTTEWTSNACETIELEMWDREEAVTQLTGGVDFSPRPVGGPTSDDLTLCTEVSVMGFGEGSAVDASDRVFYGINAEVDHENGWARMDFTLDADGDARYLLDAAQTQAIIGLPVTGFAVQKYTAAGVDGLSGSGAFYAGVIDHKSTRLIVGYDPANGADDGEVADGLPADPGHDGYGIDSSAP
ncbi:hypothetical protein QWI17_05295 [Gilvimarinus sp. SDUM040013]|uniref:Cell surface protein n=1 Tax=Gilvimarinus gilvus TaxID=3058038 RepID=A0ABU4RWH5_9GAMM|nr:hypothetical protein [Gilvimarinus sp. SDUM040013]MDO3385252.1 hypothetical protein [Gilvimarinus sp. SDUM040013]MDX6849235.1 hypothetical protein [Gilvimarinus sp. SDUM040013]